MILYYELDPFMKELHILQLGIISYFFWKITFYALKMVL